jgi:hypothetical protein
MNKLLLLFLSITGFVQLPTAVSKKLLIERFIFISYLAVCIVVILIILQLNSIAYHLRQVQLGIQLRLPLTTFGIHLG